MDKLGKTAIVPNKFSWSAFWKMIFTIPKPDPLHDNGFGAVSAEVLERFRLHCLACRQFVSDWLDRRGVCGFTMEDEQDYDEGYILCLIPDSVELCGIGFIFYGWQVEIFVGAPLAFSGTWDEYYTIKDDSGTTRLVEYLEAVTDGRVWYMDWKTHKTYGIDLNSEPKLRVYRTFWGHPCVERIERYFGSNPEKIYPCKPWARST